MNYLKSKIKNEQRKIEQLSRNRLILGLVILACWIIPVFNEALISALYPLSFVLLVGFGFLVYLQIRRRDYKKYLDQRSFIQGRWYSQLPAIPKDNLQVNSNPLWEDLDIFHDNGLFAKINITKNIFSSQKLIDIIADQDLSVDQLKARQDQVKFAYKKKGLRKILLTLFSLHFQSLSDENLQVLLKKKLVHDQSIYKLLIGFYLVLWGLYIGHWFFALKPFYILGWIFLLPLFAYAGTRILVLESYPWVSSFDSQLLRFKKTFKYKERLGFVSKEQKALIKELDQISSALGVRQNYIIYAIIHALLPWDFYWALRLEIVKAKMAAVFPNWLNEVAELEVTLQVAEFSEHLTSSSWPVFQSSDLGISVNSVTHPLMNPGKAVANSMSLAADKKLMLITGSNMAGKSTFLRTVAINQILAQLGAKVSAQEFKTSAFLVLTSLKRTDSLEDAFSTFYSEVKNLKWILTTASQKASLYFIDEIFRGTNNKERLLGSQKYIQQILKARSYGCITSHDLELAQMEKDFPTILNEHFADRVQEGRMIFDYLKKPGPCPTTNALKVMEMEGLFTVE